MKRHKTYKTKKKKAVRRFREEQITPAFRTKLGELYHADCLNLLKTLSGESVDLVFADPPFNLGKSYGEAISDNRREDEYIDWCKAWIEECVRVLRPGGSLFLWNLPRWNLRLGDFLSHRLTFRHWIATDIKYSLPIQGRLYPSHYSLLYYSKGKPKTFKPDRLPMEICPSCLADLKDYGGYKDKMNAKGVNMADVWIDIPPVRHAKYKKRSWANELSVKLMDRVIEMASQEGDVVFDPFGGSGTTFAVAEMKGRRWIGCELGPISHIVERLKDLKDERAYLEGIRSNLNALFPGDTALRRIKAGRWTVESEKARKQQRQPLQLDLTADDENAPDQGKDVREPILRS